MDAEPQNQLPWDALRHTTGPIPWAALERIAEALPSDQDALEDLLDLFDESDGEPYERHSFERLYVPAVLAMAAPRLSDAGRDRAARFLLRALTLAGDEEDEFMEDVLPAAIGVLGPETVLPVVLEFMPEDFLPWGVAFGLWQMAGLARDTKDQGLRDRVVQMCVRALERAEAGETDIRDVEMAASVLAKIGQAESRPLLQRLYDQTQLADLQDELDVLDGKLNTAVDEEPWHQPVRQWLEENWKLLREWYDDNEGPEAEEDDEDGENDTAHRRASELAAEFAKSAVLANTSPETRDRAESIAVYLLDYAWSYESARPEDLTEPVLREVLLELFPRKISADHDFYDDVSPLTQAFLDWLEGKGILADAAPLREAVRQWRDQIVARGMDPRNWGMAKSFAMSAQQSGVDITDSAAMNRFAVEYNRRLNQQPGGDQDDYTDDDPQFDPLLPATAPIVRAKPKIGPNSPCPCGSGKKHKKCCGRR